MPIVPAAERNTTMPGRVVANTPRGLRRMIGRQNQQTRSLPVERLQHRRVIAAKQFDQQRHHGKRECRQQHPQRSATVARQALISRRKIHYRAPPIQIRSGQIRPESFNKGAYVS